MTDYSTIHGYPMRYESGGVTVEVDGRWRRARTMAELIDRVALLEKLDALSEIFRRRGENEDKGFLAVQCGVMFAAEEVNDAPTIDAAPVVRCGDCRHSSKIANSTKGERHCWSGRGRNNGDGFSRVNGDGYCDQAAEWNNYPAYRHCQVAIQSQSGRNPDPYHRGYKIIAVDFDGCLCVNKWPEIGNENRELVNRIKASRAAGNKLILWTCREGKALDEAVEWCRARGLEFDAVNENLPELIERYGGDCRKISADEYWDDKAKNVKA